jgi:hypothetical protein
VRVAVFSLRLYEKSVTRLLTAAERIALENSIATDPEAHPVIPGAGGVRKARWGRGASGKRGGVRAIYYYLASGSTVYMLAVYAKADKEDLTEREKQELKRVAIALKGGQVQ